MAACLKGLWTLKGEKYLSVKRGAFERVLRYYPHIDHNNFFNLCINLSFQWKFVLACINISTYLVSNFRLVHFSEFEPQLVLPSAVDFGLSKGRDGELLFHTLSNVALILLFKWEKIIPFSTVVAYLICWKLTGNIFCCIILDTRN